MVINTMRVRASVFAKYTKTRRAHLLLMTSLPEVDLHRPLLTVGEVLSVCLLTCWNLRVRRGDDDDDLAMWRDTVNFLLTGGAGAPGDARPDLVDSGSWASPDDRDSSAKDGDHGATLWSRSSTRFDSTSTGWHSGGGVRLNRPAGQRTNKPTKNVVIIYHKTASKSQCSSVQTLL